MITLHKGKLYSASHDLTVRQWEAESGVCIHIFRGHNKYITAMVMSKDGIIYTGADDGEIRSWAAERQAALNIYKGHTRTITSLCLTDDQMYSGSFDNDIRQWDTNKTECVRIYKGHEDIVTGIVVRGDFLYSSGADKTVRKWSTIDGTCLLIMTGHTGWVWDIVILPNGYHLYSSSIDGTIRKFNSMTGKCLKIFDEAKDCVSRIALITHEGSTRLVASSWDGCIRQYDLNNDNLVNTMTGHAAKVKSMLIVNYRILISGAEDNDLRIWDLKSGSCLYRMKMDKPVTSICLGENNHVLYCANKSGTIRKYMIPRTSKSEQYLANVDSQEEQTHYSTYETSLL
jgi:WD40 repeat protein